MQKKKQQNSARHRDIVRESRAGLIPACDDTADERRARISATASVLRAVKARLAIGRCISEELVVIEALVHLRHYCEAEGLTFEKLRKAANVQYLDEVRDERS